MKNQSRRAFIKTASMSVLSLSFSLSILSRTVSSAVTAEEKPSMILQPLINALRSKNDSVCEKAANRLAAMHGNQSRYDLNLRSADLNANDIERISQLIKEIDVAGGPKLHSFSMSYNANVRDEGTVILASNLPASLTEIGLVGCGIGDKGADALIALAQRTPQLHWLCVENNPISKDMKRQLLTLGKKRSGLLVVV